MAGLYPGALVATGSPPNPRQWLVPNWFRLSAHIAVRTAGIAADPHYAALARKWGVRSPRKMYPIPVPVTGIRPLEQPRGQRYRDYQARSSAFFPLPPHKEVNT